MRSVPTHNNPPPGTEATEMASASSPPDTLQRKQEAERRIRATCPSPEPGLEGGTLIIAPVGSGTSSRGPSEKRKRLSNGDQQVREPMQWTDRKTQWQLFVQIATAKPTTRLVTKLPFDKSVPIAREERQDNITLDMHIPCCGRIAIAKADGYLEGQHTHETLVIVEVKAAQRDHKRRKH
ncbi:uncharacterized protein PGRI_093940 [Penicillium griseofulvum]|uniref:Uncharacterized protein n=1 Tax=Penicillium patulum TaxID=5078 RepID=A0A135LR14_PENPA|nr:uncharacterized protein PGRI_093940 [Penicillium griseofulvum]KXG51382.1 hypothetical protein PGRI_093940 [Penicillium griseofulvum]